MKPMIFCVFFAAMVLGHHAIAQSGKDFKGLIDNLPKSKIGDWVIGGNIVAVTAKTRFDEGNGPTVVGTCVSVDYEGTQVKVIATEKASKCLPE